MAKYRRGRINDALAQELAIALRDLRDPRIVSAIVSITRAEVTADLKSAQVYFSSLGDSREVLAALRSATGLLRHHLAQTLNLRITPELTFIPDGSIEHGAHIAALLHKIDQEDAARAAGKPREDGR